MIAACPKCHAKYRVESERLGAGEARLRCAKCQAVFRVRVPQEIRPAAPVALAPAAPGPAPPQDPVDAPVDRDRLILVADPDIDSGKAILQALAGMGLQPVLVHDGVEALLTIQRMLPRAVILDAALPKMFGFQICEMVKRNESLRQTQVALVGSVHHPNRYRRPPNELYGADLYLEKPSLLESLGRLVSDFGYEVMPAGGSVGASPPVAPARELASAAAPEPLAVPAAPAPPAAVHATAPPIAAPPAAMQAPVARVEAPAAMQAPVARVEAPAAPVEVPAAAMTVPAPPVNVPPAPVNVPPVAVAPAPMEAPAPVAPPPAAMPAAPGPAAQRGDGLDDERANAERLARIIVSDIALYQPETFDRGLESGQLVQALEGALQEGRSFFAQRIDARVCEEKDYLTEELMRVARERSGQ